MIDSTAGRFRPKPNLSWQMLGRVQKPWPGPVITAVQKPWNHDSPVNTNKQLFQPWFLSGAVSDFATIHSS